MNRRRRVAWLLALGLARVPGLWAHSTPGPSVADSYGVFIGDRYLVAGCSGAGNRDGAYLDAEFNAPAGLAVEPQDDRLFVADSGNDLIRVVDLARQDRVATLAGDGRKGDRDGALQEARFDRPTELAYAPGARLLFVLEAGGTRIRSLDLAAGTTATRVRGQGLQGLATQPGGALLWSDAAGALWRSVSTGAQVELLQHGDWPGSCAADRAVNGAVLLMRGGGFWRLTAGTGPQGLTPAARIEAPPVDCTGAFLADAWVHWDQQAGSFASYDPATGQSLRYTPKDVDGHSLLHRPAFQGVTAMAYDVNRDVFYVSEGPTNRIQAVKRYRMDALNPNGTPIYFQPSHRPPSRRRVLFVGDSTMGMYLDAPQQNLAARVELHANELAAERGLTLDLETDYRMAPIGDRNHGPASNLLLSGGAKFLKDQGYDEVFLVLHFWNLMSETVAFAENPTVDGLPSLDNTEWRLLSWKQQRLALTSDQRDLMDYLMKSYPKVFRVTSGGQYSYEPSSKDSGPEFTDPRVVDAILAREGELLDRLLPQLNSAGIKVNVILMPMRPMLIGGETAPLLPDAMDPLYFQQRLAAFAAGRGLRYFDMMDPVRLRSSVLFPLENPGDHHPNPRGHDLFGRLVAEWYLRDLTKTATTE